LYQGDAVFPFAVAKVFNTFVENSVENRHSISVSDSLRDASTLCTAASAGTFRVEPASNFLMKARSRKASPSKIRLDKLLVDRGLAASRERAQALILAGKVLVDEQKLEKSGALVAAESEIRLLGEDLKYVSRGGLKLERALEHWKIDVKDKICLDVGASTGGFTDCLLQRGAARVFAVDTGYGQMDFKLRQDPHVRMLEKTNARYLTREAVGNTVDFIAMDVSFISATLVLPSVVAAAFSESLDQRKGRQIVVLVKPQFEAGREQVGKGGIVRDEEAQRAAVEKVRAALISLGTTETDVIDSPILGVEGNREFLLHGVF
jgi:23S rRNA (cytidine1920-2'-O)/16S rRNA (cytidine1409-2'-O)-methyltransferase